MTTDARGELPVTVFGASSAQGGPVVEALLAAGRRVRAVTRSDARPADLVGRGVDVRTADLSDAAAVARAVEGSAAVFAHLPFLPVEPLVRAMATGLAAGLRAAQVPWTVFTLSGQAPTAPVGVPSFDTKATAKAVLTDAGLPLLGLEPMGYLGNLAFCAAGVVRDRQLRYPLPAEHRQPWLSTQDQARLVVAAMDRPDLAGRWYPVGERLTGTELAAAVGAARGEAVAYVPLTPQEFGAAMAAVLGPQAGEALTADYRLIAARPAELPLDADTGVLPRELGVALHPVEHWARTQDWEALAG